MTRIEWMRLIPRSCLAVSASGATAAASGFGQRKRTSHQLQRDLRRGYTCLCGACTVIVVDSRNVVRIGGRTLRAFWTARDRRHCSEGEVVAFCTFLHGDRDCRRVGVPPLRLDYCRAAEPHPTHATAPIRRARAP